MSGLIGKKIGMTSIFLGDGTVVGCTLIEAGPCFVTQVKTKEKEGYEAIQLAFDDKRAKSVSRPLRGHFKKSNVSPKIKLCEFKNMNFSLGDEINVGFFEVGDLLKIQGISKGKGFQGGVKRYGFGGVGMQTHGQHNRMRAPGSVGGSSFPSRVFKGVRMAGRMGSDKVTLKNIEVVRIVAESNILIVKGALPGAIGTYLIIKK